MYRLLYKNKFSITRQYASKLNTFSVPNSTKKDDVKGFTDVSGVDDNNDLSIKQQYLGDSVSSTSEIVRVYSDDDISKIQQNPFNRKADIPRGAVNETSIDILDFGPNDIRNYITMAYGKIPKDSTERNDLKGDFRNALEGDKKGFTGIPKNYITDSLEAKYGFGNLGAVGADRTDPNKFVAKGLDFNGKDRAIILKKDANYRGDKVTALDVNITDGIASNQVYANGGKDLIKFYFQDGAQSGGPTGNVAVMAFRATMTGFTDSFSPGWDRIDIMGRPDGAYLYNSFERSVSFNFTVDRKSTRLNSSHEWISRMPSSA